MRSRVDAGRVRVVLEAAFRAGAILALLVGLWWSWYPNHSSQVEIVDQRTLDAALLQWTTGHQPPAVHLDLLGLPRTMQRDWLVALRRSGTKITWDHVGAVGSGSLIGTAIDVEPLADPRGSSRIAVAAPRHAHVILGDRLGSTDSSFAPRGIVAFRASSATIAPVALVGGAAASAVEIDSPKMSRLLVFGRADWESKFVVRALEEGGWTVDVHLVLAPHTNVVQRDRSDGSKGDPQLTIDTTHYAAIVVIDSGVATQAQRQAIARYVGSGGGLVLTAESAIQFTALAPGRTERTIAPAPTLTDSQPRRGLALSPILGLKTSVVSLDRRDSLIAVAAWCVDRGRVAMEGYGDTWRWRMVAGDSGVTDHRKWWGELVAAVAYLPTASRRRSANADPAPLADMVDRLGQSTLVPALAMHHRQWPQKSALFAFALLLLLGEWGSRRVRGGR